ncbi:MAG TPA: VWA domain-containing protein [Terriglobales bacterium]
MPFASRATNLHVQNSGLVSIVRTLLTLLPLLLAALALHAQQAPQAPPAKPAEHDQQETTTISKDVNVVNVLATVRNKQGQIVNNLTKDDFKLEDDGRPQTIKYFAKVTDMPLTLGLLVDTSLSQRRVLEQERTASYTFLEDLLREWKDKAFVVHFDSEVELLQDLTSSRPKLEAALQKLEVGSRQQSQSGSDPTSAHMVGGTLLNDAVFLAADEIMSKQQGRKALIILSDGVDQGSKVSLTRAIEAAQRADTLVYTILFADPQAYNNQAGNPGGGGGRHGGGFPGGGGIGFPGGGYPGGGRQGGGYPGGGYPGGGGGGGSPGGGRGGGGRSQGGHADGKQVMQRLAQQTGGRFYEVSKKETIEQIYTSIGEDLRNQYNLGFTPDLADAEAGYHKILLTTTQKDMTVQARDGYYSGK